MIKVQFFENKEGFLIGFEAYGHAGFDEVGKDIVCAGVSSLLQTAYLSLKEIIKTDVRLIKKKGYLCCKIVSFSQKDVEKIDLVLRTALLGIEYIEKSYNRFLTLETVRRC